jgi:HTH-like domain/Integrase core domain
VSVARFIADHRTFYRVPHAVTCAILGVSVSWFYKWVDREPTDRQRRRAELDARVRVLFDASGRTYGSPRIHADLLAEGWRVGVNTVADSMRRQGLQGRKPKRRKGLTKQDKQAAKFPDLLKRDFTASAPNRKWCGDITEIPTDEGKLYLASVLDLCGRRLLAAPMSDHPDAELAGDAIKMAAAARGGRAVIDEVIFHTDYAEVCVKPRICGDGLCSVSCWWIPRLNVSRLSQTVEGLELVFGERLGGRGVDGGGGGVDGFAHHVQGRKGIERCCGGSVFVAEEAHDDR